jgi:ELWxxDGT repeat protein
VTFLKDLTPGAPAGYADEGAPSDFVQVGRYAYFSNYFLNYAEGKYFWELWRTDGTPAGTEMIYGETYAAEVQPEPGNLTDVGNALYYTAPVPPRGETEPWRFDGTTGTPILVGNEFYQTQVISYLTPVGNALYFTTSGTQQSQELWKCVGTTVTQVYDNQYPFEILGVTALGNDVYFFAPVGGDFSGNYHLFRYDGTTATDLTPATYVDAYEGSTVAGNSIYFFSAALPQQMLEYDGTSVTQVPLGSSVTADVNSLTAVGNTLYFRAVVDSQGDEQLYKYDGTTLTPITAGTAVSSQFTALQAVGNTVYFDAEVDSQGDEQLFAYPGTGTTATQVVVGTYSNPSPFSLTPVGDALYFSAQVDAAGDRQLFRYDGTTATEIPVGTFANPNPTFFTAIGNTVYFDAQVDSRGDQQLWETSLTSAPAIVVLERNGPSNPDGSVHVGNNLYVSTPSATGDQELWLVKTPRTVPAVTVSDPGGTYSGQVFPATATVNGATSLEGVSPRLTYHAGNSTGPLLRSAPTAAGIYTVVASFAGSADYAPASAQATFTIKPATPTPGLYTLTVTDTGGLANGKPYTARGLALGLGGKAIRGKFRYVYADSQGHTSTAAPMIAGNYSVFAVFSSKNPDYASATSASVPFTITPTVARATMTLPASATTFVLHGFGFDPQVANDNVTLSSGSARVMRASAYSLTISVNGLSLGALSVIVTVDGISGTSTLVAAVVPEIARSAASLSVTATSLIIEGMGFDPNLANDVVTFNGGVTGILAEATATQLTVTSLEGLKRGALVASVTIDGESSGAGVEVANVT